MTDQNTEIRRNADGSIDTNYYVAHCHHMRSLAAHHTIGRLFETLKSVFRNCQQTDVTDVRAGVAPGPDASEPLNLQETTAFSKAA